MSVTNSTANLRLVTHDFASVRVVTLEERDPTQNKWAIVFIVDVSGSMGGIRMAGVKDILGYVDYQNLGIDIHAVHYGAFDTSASEVSCPQEYYPRGGTKFVAMADAAANGIESVLAKGYTNILLVPLTDGDANDHVSAAARFARRMAALEEPREAAEMPPFEVRCCILGLGRSANEQALVSVFGLNAHTRYFDLTDGGHVNGDGLRQRRLLDLNPVLAEMMDARTVTLTVGGGSASFALAAGPAHVLLPEPWDGQDSSITVTVDGEPAAVELAEPAGPSDSAGSAHPGGFSPEDVDACEAAATRAGYAALQRGDHAGVGRAVQALRSLAAAVEEPEPEPEPEAAPAFTQEEAAAARAALKSLLDGTDRKKRQALVEAYRFGLAKIYGKSEEEEAAPAPATRSDELRYAANALEGVSVQASTGRMDEHTRRQVLSAATGGSHRQLKSAARLARKVDKSAFDKNIAALYELCKAAAESAAEHAAESAAEHAADSGDARTCILTLDEIGTPGTLMVSLAAVTIVEGAPIDDPARVAGFKTQAAIVDLLPYVDLYRQDGCLRHMNSPVGVANVPGLPLPGNPEGFAAVLGLVASFIMTGTGSVTLAKRVQYLAVMIPIAFALERGAAGAADRRVLADMAAAVRELGDFLQVKELGPADDYLSSYGSGVVSLSDLYRSALVRWAACPSNAAIPGDGRLARAIAYVYDVDLEPSLLRFARLHQIGRFVNAINPDHCRRLAGGLAKPGGLSGGAAALYIDELFRNGGLDPPAGPSSSSSSSAGGGSSSSSAGGKTLIETPEDAAANSGNTGPYYTTRPQPCVAQLTTWSGVVSVLDRLGLPASEAHLDGFSREAVAIATCFLASVGPRAAHGQSTVLDESAVAETIVLAHRALTLPSTKNLRLSGLGDPGALHAASVKENREAMIKAAAAAKAALAGKVRALFKNLRHGFFTQLPHQGLMANQLCGYCGIPYVQCNVPSMSGVPKKTPVHGFANTAFTQDPDITFDEFWDMAQARGYLRSFCDGKHPVYSPEGVRCFELWAGTILHQRQRAGLEDDFETARDLIEARLGAGPHRALFERFVASRLQKILDWDSSGFEFSFEEFVDFLSALPRLGFSAAVPALSELAREVYDDLTRPPPQD